MLCCTPDVEVWRDRFGEAVPVVPFQPPRPVTVDAIRSLAPAVSPANAAILVRWRLDRQEADACEIAGIVHVGAQLARARSGRSFHSPQAPFALVIEVREAGELHVYQGSVKLAAFRSGELHDQIAFSALEFLPMNDILARGEAALRPAITTLEDEWPAASSDFLWTALLNTILCIVNGVREHGHGGTVLLVAPGSEGTLPVRLKYDVDANARVLAQRFVRFLTVGHELTERRRRRERGRETGGAAALAALQTAAFAADSDLADAADLVSRWTAVDGAVVLSSDLRVLGFGAEIVLDAAAPVRAYEVRGRRGSCAHAAAGRQRELRDAAPIGLALRGGGRQHGRVRRLPGRRRQFLLEAGRPGVPETQREHGQSQRGWGLKFPLRPAPA